MADTAYFGFKEIEASKKESKVGEVFSSVANSYDLMNNLMSLGMHHLWKDHMVDLLPNLTNDLLDVAGGTADIASRYYKRATLRGKNPRIIVCDINPDMLDIGKEKLINDNILSGIDFVLGNAEELPFEDNSFSYYTISFGIRNVTNIDKALKEAHRVLKSGGKFVCLEFSCPQNALFNKIYDLYSFQVIPLIGKLVANDKDAYQYLVESIRKFPKQRDFANMIKEAGFTQVNYINLTSGVTAIHYGYKI